MKNFLFALSLGLVVSLTAAGQKTGPLYLPPQSNNIPAWFKPFYNPDKLAGVNVFSLEKQAMEYEKLLKKQYRDSLEKEQNGSSFKAEDHLYKNNEPIGEEQQDAYLLYLKRWRRALDNNIKPNGKIISLKDKQKELAEINKFAAAQQTNTTSTSNTSPDGPLSSAWSFLGPVKLLAARQHISGQPERAASTNVYAVAVAPSNPNILYACAETGGVFKTIDKGLSWTLIYDKPAASYSDWVSTYKGLAYYAVTVHPANPDIVYIGRRNLVEKSTDGGITWATNSSLTCGDITTIDIDPGNTNHVMLSGENGIWQTTNGGTSWTVVPGTNGFAFFDIAFKIGNPATVFALKKNAGKMQFLTSLDNGATFNVTGGAGWPGTLNVSGARFTVTPADPEIIYTVLLAEAPSVAMPHIYKSTDGGANFSFMCSGITNNLRGTNALPLGMSNGQGFYDLDIIASATNANQVIVATTSSYRSTDGGTTFTAFGGYQGGYPGGSYNLHPDIQQMITNGADTWIATDGGMYYSTDFFSTTNYEPRTNGMCGADYWGFTQGWNEDIVGGGKYHNGDDVLSGNYPAGTSLILGGAEEATGHYMIGRPGQMLFRDAGGGLKIPTTINGTIGSFYYSGTYPNYDEYGSDPSELEFSPASYSTIYLGKENLFYKSEDGGLGYSVIHNFGTERVKRFEISRSHPNTIYLSTNAKLYKTTNGGTSWSVVPTPGAINGRFYNVCISIDADNPDIVWIAGLNFPSNNRIFKSTDGGASWTNLTTAKINGFGIRSMFHQLGTNGGVYIFSEGGNAFYRNNTMSNWAEYNTGLPKSTYPLTALPFYRDSKIRLAGNRGIWEAGFFEEGQPKAQPMVSASKIACQRDTVYYEDFSALNHSGATWSWSFPGAAYVSSTTIRNPKVLYSAPGSYDATLTVTNSAGSSSKTVTGIAQVLATSNCQPDTLRGNAFYAKTSGSSYGYGESFPNMPAGKAFTITAWVKPDAAQVNTAGLFSYTSDNGTIRYVLNFGGAAVGDSIQLHYHPNWWWASGLFVKLNQWNHIAMVVDATSVSLYVNGKKSTHTGLTNATMSSDHRLVAGTFVGAEWWRYFNGLFDEVALYKSALDSNQIRSMMHLTLNNSNYPAQHNPDLVAYYQFNDPGLALKSKDKINVADLFFSGNQISKDSVSAAPVGGGVSQKITVPASAVSHLAECNIPGVKLAFSAGTKPNGDIWVSRINVPSDVAAGPNVLPNNPRSYYTVHNYGSNKTFAPLDSMVFTNVQGINSGMVAAPANLKLFKRGSSAFGNTWGAPIDNADEVREESTEVGAVKFSAGLNMTGFSQFSIVNQLAPLPVKLVSFSVAEINCKAVVSWLSGSETDFKQYVVEYSTNGSDFYAVGAAEPKGSNSQYGFNYTPAHGRSYFRLKMEDADGSFAYSSIALVNNSCAGKSVAIYPNPASQVFNVNISGYSGKIKLEMSNHLGQLVLTKQLQNGSNSFNCAGLTAGIYTITLMDENGTTESYKITITH